MLTDGGFLEWFLASLWWPFAAGLLIQMSVTQWAKLHLPRRWPARRLRSTTNLIALAAGVIPTAVILWQMGHHQHELWLAAVVGVSGPMLYKAATRLIYSRWPELEGSLSAQGRAPRKLEGSRGQ